MNEITTPALIPIDTVGNLTNLIAERAWFEPERVVASRPLGDGWQAVSAKEFEEEIKSVAKGLVASGISIGDRVAIMSRTRYEWTILDFAIWYAGAVSVPIYETSSAEQIDWILNDSAAVAIIVETQSLAELAKPVMPVACKNIWNITDNALAILAAAGKSITDDEISKRRDALKPETLATLIYTSGTTGKPKGVQLTHGNFQAECGNVVNALNCSDTTKLLSDLATFKPTFVLAVPRIFEKIYNGAEAKAEAAGKGKIFHKAAETAISYSKALDTKRISPLLKIKHGVFDKLVYSKIRTSLGGKVEAAISGGAPLGDRLGHFFRGAGIRVLEGYGLTETTGASNVNTTASHRVGSVGKPIPGATIKIAEDGEVSIKGAVVMQGYWQNDAANAEVFTKDNYFKSGDLGKLDDEGYLYITGRKKELIVTAGGKNVAPAVLEDRLRSNPLISQCMVVGDNKPFIAALITLDPDSIKPWSVANKKEGASIADLAKDPTLLSAIQSAVDETNKAVSKAESIRKFTVLPIDFTIAGGHLTAKLSVKRHVVAQQFAREIDELFT
ncbi:MAG: long-chain fatty acid--CoA ligase [Actinobacteria bacterium]|nr:long-chain fatty acid--CoA ligase [Actinomycetota bacterium]